MRAIVRKSAHRAGLGKASAFTIRGKAVDFKDVHRYWERKGVSMDDVIKLQEVSRTPEAVECFSPLQSPLKTPENLAAPERILIKLQDYVKGSFDAGIWKDSGEGYMCQSIKSRGDRSIDTRTFYDQCQLAMRLLRKNRCQEAGQVLSACCANIKEILLEETPVVFQRLLATVFHLGLEGKRDIALIILRQISAMGAILYGNGHPFKTVSMEISSLASVDQEEFLLRSLRKIGDCFEHTLGPMHVTTLDCRLQLIESITGLQDLEEAERRLWELLRHCESSLRENDPRVLDVHMAFWFYYFTQRNFIQANEMYQRVLALSKHMGDQVNCLWFRRVSLRCLAMSHYGLGEVQAATTIMREAIELYLHRDSPELSLACRLMLYLEDWLAELGEVDSAAKVNEERMWLQESFKANDFEQLSLMESGA